MKLKDILTEGAYDWQEWLKTNMASTFKGKIGELAASVDSVDENGCSFSNGGRISINVARGVTADGIVIAPKTDHLPLTIPVGTEVDVKWLLIELYKLNDFSNVPDVENLVCSGCNILSLKGIENLNKLTTILFDRAGGFNQDTNETSNSPGLLRLLKCKNLKKIEFGTDEHNDDNANWPLKVRDILNDHLTDKNIIECQNDLIDAGFEEFAKL